MNRLALRTSFLVLGLALSTAGQAATSISCHSILLTGELSAGNHFEKLIGGGLEIRLDPARLGPKGDVNGWDITLVPLGKRNDDYIYPVNPPLRFNALQLLGPGYGEDTKSSLERAHQMRFLLSAWDFDRISPLLTNALWPYSAPHPDKALDDYASALKTLTTGELKFVVQRYGADPDTGSIRHIEFRAEFTAPDSFGFDSALQPKRTPCAASPE
jgi:hypothetical protein